MMQQVGLSTARWNNNIKSVLLMSLFPCLLLGVLALYFWAIAEWYSDPTCHVLARVALGYGYLLKTDDITCLEFTKERTLATAPLVFSCCAAWVIIGFWFNDAFFRFAAKGVVMTRSAYPTPYNLLENLSIQRGLKMPKLYLIETTAMNAYASGININSSSITLTKGLLDKLDDHELEAVFAHEVTHILNYDTRLLTVTALFCGMLHFIPESIWKNVNPSGWESWQEKAAGFLTLIVARGNLIIALLLSFVLAFGSFLSSLFNLALSRKREYLADIGAVELTKNPEALASALGKIAGNADMPFLPSGLQAALIESPPRLIPWSNRHPLIEDRIAALQKLADEAKAVPVM